MAAPQKRSGRKKTKKKRTPMLPVAIRVFSTLFLVFILLFSVCAVGYVIFFRTVFARTILPQIKSAIVFEEPNPPVHRVRIRKVPKSTPSRLPMVAIIIDDMGYHQAIDRKLIGLPVELTYSFLPFAPFTSELEWLTYRSGKTVLLHLPLQPKGREWDPGPGALYVNDSPAEQDNKFERSLQEVPHAVGVNNHMGSLYTQDEKAMTGLMEKIREHKLYFVDSYTSAGSVGLPVAQALQVKSARRHVFLDNVQDKNKICNQLKKLVNIAESSGAGIGIGHPYQATVEALLSCTKDYSARVRYVSIADVLEQSGP